MNKYFPHILKQIISPQTIVLKRKGILQKYFSNRQKIKQCKQLWPQFTKKNITKQGAVLYSRLREALLNKDKVQILKVCSIPFYEKFIIQKPKLLQKIYNVQLEFIDKIIIQKQSPISQNKQWMRVFLTFHHFQQGKTFKQTHCIERKILKENNSTQKKWYIAQLNL